MWIRKWPTHRAKRAQRQWTKRWVKHHGDPKNNKKEQ